MLSTIVTSIGEVSSLFSAFNGVLRLGVRERLSWLDVLVTVLATGLVATFPELSVAESDEAVGVGGGVAKGSVISRK